MAAGQENSLNVQVKNVSNLIIFYYCYKAVAVRYFFFFLFQLERMLPKAKWTFRSIS